MQNLIVNIEHEHDLRALALEIAKGIKTPAETMRDLGVEEEKWVSLENNRVFKAMLLAANAEWSGASNTQKRVKLKAATNVEMSLPAFYKAMIDPNEHLVNRAKILEIMAKIGQLGVPEVAGAVNNGQYFKLEINMGEGKPALVVNMGRGPELVEGSDDLTLDSNEGSDHHDQISMQQSALLDQVEWDELS
jgi:hypothetical protein